MDAKDALKILNENEAVKAALGAEGISVLAELSSTVESLSEKLKESDAAKGRILAEKKTEQEKRSAIEAEFATLKESGLSDAEKISKAAEREKARADNLEAEFKALQSQHAQDRRTIAMDKVASGIRFIDTLPPQAGRILIESHLAGIEDMSDANTVGAALEAFKATHKGILAADPQGSGAGSRGAGSEGAGTGAGLHASPSERQEQLKKMGAI